MYPNLPDWDGPPWSFLLTPDWRRLSGRPLADIVCHQWETATRILLDDLEAGPREDWTTVEHGLFVADPQAEVRRLAAWAGWEWDREVGELPLSRYTLTPPDPDKWRRHEADLGPRLAVLQPTIARARAALSG
jgi:hypothetical protein